MPFNGIGVFNLPSGSIVSDGTTIDAADHNVPLQDIESSLSATILRNGAAAFTANQSIGSNRLTSLGAGTAATDAATVRQVQSGSVSQATAVAGTVNAITLTFAPPYTAYIPGMTIRWISGGQNTSTVTINVDGLGVQNLQKDNSVALSPLDLPPSGAICEATFDGTRFLLHQTFLTQSLIYPGMAMVWPGVAEPPGWLFCFGQEVSRTTYANLFTAISTAYGAGDGSTTFNLPDYRDRTVIGRGDMGGTGANRLSVTITGTTTAGSAVVTGLSSTAGIAVGMLAIGANIPAGRTIASIDSATQVTSNSGTSVTAGSASIRFASIDSHTLGATGGTNTHTLSEPELALHGHPYRASYISQSTANSDVNGGFMHNNSSVSNQAAFTGTPSNTQGQGIGGSGGGRAHNNVQPSIVANWIIKT